MCGRFVALSDPDGLVRFLVVDERRTDADLAPNYNVAPTQEVYAAAHHDERRFLVTFRWGLVPSWADDPKIGARMINARAETLEAKPAFRESFERRRCLIPADGFYEWLRTDQTKVPHFIHATDGAPLAFAGLWSSWRDRATGERLRTCTIVTKAAVPELQPLHDRMPAALRADTWDAWLDPATSTGELRAILGEAPPTLTFHPVSPRVNDHRNSDPSLLDPVQPPQG